MVDIQVGKKQGLTQAVASKLGLSKDECKKIDVSVWKQVVTEIDNEQQNINQHNRTNPNDPKASIFSGGNDVSTIDRQSNWKSDFITQEGSFTLSDESWNRISGLLGKPVEKPEDKPEDKKPEEKPTEAPKPDTEGPDGKVRKRSVDGEKAQIVITKDDKGRKVRHELNADGTQGDSLAATRTFGKNKYISGDFPPETRIFTRTVDGNKDAQIGVYKDDNGNKVRKLVVTDKNTGKKTLGETLVPVTTGGKNTYVTQSQFEAQVKKDLGLTDEQAIPQGVTAEYKHGKLVYKKDGKTVPVEDLRKPATTPKEQQSPEAKDVQDPKAKETPYARRMNTWRNGLVGTLTEDGKTYVYTCATSKDEKTKAYKIEGNYYGLDRFGLPDMSKKLDKSQFE